MNARSVILRAGILASAAFGVVLLPAPPAPGYPISPVTLWELTAEADLIVWAKVEEEALPRGSGEPDDDFNSAAASLRVLETWKGRRRERVEVRYAAGMICPAPARYLPGRRVLAFLDREPGGYWTTVGLSYGSLYPSDDEIGDYRHLVRWALQLQRGDRPARAGEHLDWVVEAASRPGTRWHGLYELHPIADRVHAYYDQSQRPAGEWRLSRHHLERIADGFVAVPPTDRALPMTLALLAGVKSPDVDRAGVAVMEALIQQDRFPYWIRDALGLLFLRFGDPDAPARLAALGDDRGPIDPERLREVWQRARSELAIPVVEPAELPKDVVWGVGSSPPD